MPCFPSGCVSTETRKRGETFGLPPDQGLQPHRSRGQHRPKTRLVPTIYTREKSLPNSQSDVPGARVAAESTATGEGVVRLPPRLIFSGASVQDAAGFGLAVTTCANDTGTVGGVNASHLESASL